MSRGIKLLIFRGPLNLAAGQGKACGVYAKFIPSKITHIDYKRLFCTKKDLNEEYSLIAPRYDKCMPSLVILGEQEVFILGHSGRISGH